MMILHVKIVVYVAYTAEHFEAGNFENKKDGGCVKANHYRFRYNWIILL